VSRIEITTSSGLSRSSVSFFYDRFRFDYADIRDNPAGGAAGTQPLSGYDADVFRLFVSGWF